MTGDIQAAGAQTAHSPAEVPPPNLQDVIALLEANRADGAFGRAHLGDGGQAGATAAASQTRRPYAPWASAA